MPSVLGSPDLTGLETAMRHATPDDLQSIEHVLRPLRALPGMVERGPGRFYRRSSAFLHFHEDRSALFADLKRDGDWVRFPLRSAREGERLLAAVRKLLA